MNAICPVSDKVVEYLSANEGEPLHSSDYALEMFSVSKGSLAFSILIRRGLEPDTFIACSVSSIDLTSNQPGYTPEPVEEFLRFLGVTSKDVPVCDGGHLGPLSSEGMLRLLELTHATYALCKMHDDADALREKFRLCTNPPAGAALPRPPAEKMHVEGNVFRPSQWHR